MNTKSRGRTSFIGSVNHCLDGISYTLKTERNFRIEFIFAFLVVILGFILKISLIEWIICLLLISFVLVLELINTAIERLTDFVKKDYDEEIKNIKDITAAFVFVMSSFAFVIGLIIFAPKILALIIGG